MQRKNLEKFLTKVDRISAWVLLVTFILYIISGYGLTRGLIDRSVSQGLHVQYLPLIIIIAFTLHVGLALRLAFVRWQAWNKFSKTVLILACMAFLGFFVYVELFYQGMSRPEQTGPEMEIEYSQLDEGLEIDIVSEPLEEASGLRIFTLEELSYYDGQDGRPAYVAVDGIVYDNTEVFGDGHHYSHLAGQELTEEFYSYHVLEEIIKYPVVGQLAD